MTFFRPITKILSNGTNIFGAIQSRREARGISGPVGEKGKDGLLTKKAVSSSEFDETASKVYLKNWKNIGVNGWRVIFKNKET